MNASTLADDSEFASRYTLLPDELGRGAFSECYAALRKDDHHRLAVKIVSKNQRGCNTALEIDILRVRVRIKLRRQVVDLCALTLLCRRVCPVKTLYGLLKPLNIHFTMHW
jgi:hypothetical protein